MSSHEKKVPQGDYSIGYANPPFERRFRKGRSGNPRGRPRGVVTQRRLNALVLREAYRPVTVREGGKEKTMPAIQALLRSLMTQAVRGKGPAQRMLIQAIQAIEHQNAAQAEIRDPTPHMTDLELARRIAFILTRADKKLSETQSSPPE
jgi:Family of unknown function (DUF5681)